MTERAKLIAARAAIWQALIEVCEALDGCPDDDDQDANIIEPAFVWAQSIAEAAEDLSQAEASIEVTLAHYDRLAALCRELPARRLARADREDNHG